MDELEKNFKAEYEAMQKEFEECDMDSEERERAFKNKMTILEQWNKHEQVKMEVTEKRKASKLSFIGTTLGVVATVGSAVLGFIMFATDKSIQKKTIDRALDFEAKGNIFTGTATTSAVKKAIDGKR